MWILIWVSEPLYLCEREHFMNKLERYEIYKAYKDHFNDIPNDKIYFTTNIFYDTATNSEFDITSKGNTRRVVYERNQIDGCMLFIIVKIVTWTKLMINWCSKYKYVNEWWRNTYREIEIVNI